MSETVDPLETLMGRGYQHGFVTDIESDTVPPGLDEEPRAGLAGAAQAAADEVHDVRVALSHAGGADLGSEYAAD